MADKFKHLNIDDAKDAPKQEEIAAIEFLLGVSLPADFLDFLNAANGAYLDYCVRVPSSGEVLSFCSIYYAGKNEQEGYNDGTFIYEIESERKSKKIPKKFLPFACDGGSSVIYIDLTIEGKGRVVAFVHGLPAWTSTHNQEDNFVELAPNFAAYLDMLFRCTDEL